MGGWFWSDIGKPGTAIAESSSLVGAMDTSVCVVSGSSNILLDPSVRIGM